MQILKWNSVCAFDEVEFLPDGEWKPVKPETASREDAVDIG